MDPISTTARTYSLIAQQYSDKYYDYFKKNLEHLTVFMHALPKAAKVLDVGSGPGGVSEYLLQQGYKVIGIDNAHGMIEIARKRVQAVDFRDMDMRYLDFPDNTFEGIIADYSLIHIPKADLILTLAGFYRVLKSEGVFYVSLFEGNDERFIDEPFKPEEKVFWDFIPAETFRRMLVDTGFELLYEKKQKTQAEEEFLRNELFFVAKKK